MSVFVGRIRLKIAAGHASAISFRNDITFYARLGFFGQEISVLVIVEITRGKARSFTGNLKKKKSEQILKIYDFFKNLYTKRA